VNIYEVHNSGNWYNFGFVLGLSVVFGSGSRASKPRRAVRVLAIAPRRADRPGPYGPSDPGAVEARLVA
jgi:hypothetical protein